MRHLLAGEDLRQLFRTAGGVFGGDDPQHNIVRISQHRPQHRNGLRLVIFDADQYLTRLENLREDTNTLDDLRGTVLHQAIVSGNVRLAFGGINNQRFDFIAAALQFIAGWEARAAEARHAKLMDALNQLGAGAGAIVAPAVALNPAVFTVGIDNHAQLGQRRGMRGRVGGNRHHRTGCRSVNGQHTSAPTSQRLAAQDAIADGHAQLALSADVLFQRNDETPRQRDLAQRRTV